jgi:hypothetical protein
MAPNNLPQPTTHQLTFIDIANTSYNINPYPWQYELGGDVIEAIENNKPITLLCIRPTDD